MDSTHHERPDGVACFFQCVVHPVISASPEARDILKENPTGSHFAHQPHGVEEQSGALAIDATPFGVRRRGVLTGRASADDVGKESEIAEKSICAERSDVVIHPHAGIVLGEDCAPPRIDLAGGNRGEACTMQTKGPTTRGAAEQVQRPPCHAARSGMAMISATVMRGIKPQCGRFLQARTGDNRRDQARTPCAISPPNLACRTIIWSPSAA